TGAVERVQLQAGRAGAGGVAGAGAQDLAVVLQKAHLTQLGIGVAAPGQHPVAVARISRQSPAGVAIGQEAVTAVIGEAVAGGRGDGHLGDQVEGALGAAAAAVEPVGLVVIAPGRVGLPGEGDPAVDGRGGQAHRGGCIGYVQAGELAGGRVGVVELQAVAVGVGHRV
ncbi:hypothetical protein, partial [Spirosoma flavum]